MGTLSSPLVPGGVERNGAEAAQMFWLLVGRLVSGAGVRA